jgi:hypothetical protein
MTKEDCVFVKSFDILYESVYSEKTFNTKEDASI